MPQRRFYALGVTAEVCTSGMPQTRIFSPSLRLHTIWPKKTGGSRPPVPNLPSLERPAQRELNEPRIPVRPHNLAERTAGRICQVLLDIRY